MRTFIWSSAAALFAFTASSCAPPTGDVDAGAGDAGVHDDAGVAADTVPNEPDDEALPVLAVGAVAVVLETEADVDCYALAITSAVNAVFEAPTGMLATTSSIVRVYRLGAGAPVEVQVEANVYSSTNDTPGGASLAPAGPLGRATYAPLAAGDYALCVESATTGEGGFTLATVPDALGANQAADTPSLPLTGRLPSSAHPPATIDPATPYVVTDAIDPAGDADCVFVELPIAAGLTATLTCTSADAIGLVVSSLPETQASDEDVTLQDAFPIVCDGAAHEVDLQPLVDELQLNTALELCVQADGIAIVDYNLEVSL